MKSYSLCGQNRKTRIGTLWNNLCTRTTGRHKDSCYDAATNGFADFQEFAEWCYSCPEYHLQDRDGFWELDKDLLSLTREYSSETCLFIPKRLNNLLIAFRTACGVTQDLNNSSNYVARGRDISGIKRHLGSFESRELAEIAYLKHKRAILKEYMMQNDLPQHIVLAIKKRWDI